MHPATTKIILSMAINPLQTALQKASGNSKNESGSGMSFGMKSLSYSFVMTLLFAILPSFGLALIPLVFYALYVDMSQSEKLTHPAEPLNALFQDINISKVIFYTVGILAVVAFIIILVMIIVAVYYALNPAEGIMAFVKGIISYIAD